MHIWHIRLFGNLSVSRDDETFSRFTTRKTGSLLAYLAFFRTQGHSREALCELLWPDEPPQQSRARLRVALSSLRRQFEPPGIGAGSVIRADGHERVQLVPEAVTTDVAEVERALTLLAGEEGDPGARLRAGQRVVALFTQPLLSGLYDDWVVSERERLCQAAVERLAALAAQLPPETGLALARHASRLDPLAEEPLFALLPLLADHGQRAAARRAFETFSRRWEAQMGAEPSPELQALAASVAGGGSRHGRGGIGAASPPASPASALPSPPPPQHVPLRLPPAASEPPPPPVRLPSYLTRFFGREAERAALHAALAEARLVTLTGPGGTGKPRLAVESARARPGGGPRWFVPLAEVRRAEWIPAAICDALGDLARGGARSAPDSPDALLSRAASALAARPGEPLLVLDNLEQIADDAGSLLLALLERAPNLRLLVTSRLRLHLPGERELPLEPLPTPPLTSRAAGEQGTPEVLEEAARIASVALFLDRARASRPDFQITERNRDDVLAICRTLEGIPLALELVAARAGTLTPAQMRARLGEAGAALRLADRRAGPGDRHHSLHAAIDWSYRLLPADLRRLFGTLSVFRGGFTVEAATAVCRGAAEAVGDGLARLRAHSLVASVADASEVRYSLLETLRAFAAERLTPEEVQEASRSHADWFADLAERADEGISGADQPAWLERIDADLDNLRAAQEWALAWDPPRAVQMAGAVWMYWHLRGRPTEGRIWLERALAAYPAAADSEGGANDPAAPPLLLSRRSRALHGAGTLAWVQGDGAAARPLFEDALGLRRAVGDTAGVAGTLNNLGLLAWSRQELDEARRFLGESLEIRRRNGATPAALASSLHNLGVVNWERGDYAASRSASREALALCREAGDRVGEGHALNNLGNVALALSDLEAAESWYAQSLEVKRVLGYPPGIAATLSNVGVTAMRRGRLAEAAAHFEESLTLYRQMDAPEGIVTQLRNLGQIALERGEWEHARHLLSQSLSMRRASDNPSDVAGNLEAFALLEAARGEAARAARMLGFAAARRAGSRTPLHPSERTPIDRAAAAARAALGDGEFERSWREGASLTVEDAVQLALEFSEGIALTARKWARG